jgi:hypothetical protein
MSPEWPGSDTVVSSRRRGPCGDGQGVSEQREWAVPCTDAVGRPRQLTVRATAEGGTLHFPPAGSATILSRRALVLVMVLDMIDRRGVAVTGQSTAGRFGAGRERTAGSPGVVRPTLPCPAVPELAVAPGCSLLPPPGAAAFHRPDGAR